MTKKRKYNAVQLSQILSSHTGKQLVSGGHGFNTDHKNKVRLNSLGCIEQVALGFTGANSTDQKDFYDIASNYNLGWFDDHYRKNWDVDDFLMSLEIQGLA